MKIRCPKCKAIIAPGQINIPKDVAFCEKCCDAFQVSQLFDEDIDFNSEVPPDGAWYTAYPNSSIIVGASTRSPSAFFLIPFTMLWSGMSMRGIYVEQFISGQFNLWQSIIGLPFLFGTIVLVIWASLAVAGKIEIEIGDDVKIFTGIGSIGWTRSIALQEVESVYEESASQSNFPLSNPKSIVIKAGETYKLMPSFREARHDYVLRALRFEINKRKSI